MGSSFRLYWRRLHDYLQGVPALKRDFGTRPRSGRRPFVEYLEDRIVPAFSLTLSLNATVGVMTSANFPVPGTTTFSATASGANLSWVDIANTLAVAGNNVIVNSGSAGTEAGNITDQLVGGIAINNQFSKNLSFQSGSGAGLVGDITIGSVRFSNGNGSIDVAANANVSVGNFDFQSGQLTSSSLSSATATVNGGDDQAVNLAVSASTGIGSLSTPFLTTASNFVAQTITGGIFVNNNHDVTIGFAGDPFKGIHDTGASGDINLTNAGSVTVTTSGEDIQGPANVTVTANGATANIQTAGTQEAIQNLGAGTLTVTAGQDVILGTAASFGDINADQYGNGGIASVVVNAGRDITIQGVGVSFLDALGATGDVTATAGRNITLVPGQASIFTNGGGTITFTAGGSFTDGAGNNFSTTMNSLGADIIITAATMSIQSPINAGTASVTLQQSPGTENIDLGTNPSAGNLGLAQADLNNITAGILRIGATANTGNIIVSAPITSAGTGWTTLSLLTGGGIIDNNATEPDIAVTNLATRSANGCSLDTAVTNLAFNNTGGTISFRNTGALTIASVEGLAASTNTGTTTTVSASSPITFTVDMISAGTITATTTETASETGTPLPPPDDDITVNSGVTVESTGGDVDLTSGDSIVLQSGSTVKADVGAVNLAAGVGDNDNDATLVLNGTIVSAAGISLSSPGDICVSNINAPGQTVRITSTNGAILDCFDPTADPGDTTLDVVAARLQLSASTGIGIVSGAGTGPLETQVGNLVAVTSTGGIFMANTGNLTIGFAGDLIKGVRDMGASGDINLTNAGNINIVTLNEVIQGPANVTVTATGAAANILAASNNGVATPPFVGSIVSTGGTVTVTAGQDLLAGNPGTSSVGNIFGGGSLVLTAGRDITIDADSFIEAHGTGTITATAGRNISMLQDTFQGAHLTTQGGAIALRTGAGGVFTLNSGAGGSVSASGGNISVSADDMVINDPINAGAGIVTLQQATTTTRNIDLGGGLTPGDLGLSDAELGQVTAGVLRIGRLDNAGSITVTAPVTTHAGYNTLDLLTGSTISQNPGATISVTNLALQAPGGVALGLANPVSQVAGVTSNTTFTFGAVGTLTVGLVDGVLDISAGSGNVNLTVGTAVTTGILKSQFPNDNVADVTGNTVTLTAVGSSNGATGQIGFFTASAQFFEVASTTLNASTNNSRLWVSSIGGTAIGTVSAGTEFAILKTVNGNLTSTHTGNTPDVIGGTVILQSPGVTGSFGTAANPLLLQTANLRASVTGTGSINVRNVPAGGNLNVASATTTNGAINLGVAGGNLTTTATTGTDISAPGNTVTLTVSGAVLSGTGAGVTDVGATNLAITSGNGIGTLANPLKTAVANLAFHNTAGLVDIANTGALTINSVGALTTSFNNGTTTTLSAASPIVFAVNTSSAGTLTATAVDNTPGPSNDNITVNPGITVQSTGGDVVFLAGDDINVNAGATVQAPSGNIDFRTGFGDNDNEGVMTLNGTVTANAATGTVALNVNSSNTALPPGTDIVTEGAAASITGASLLLLNFTPGATGAFALDTATANNVVGTIAATTNAVIHYHNTGPLTVGTVTSTDEAVTSFGIFTTNHDVTLCTTTPGDLTLAQFVNAGSGIARLDSAGNITETGGAIVTANTLGARADGNINMANPNAANNVALQAGGTIVYNSAGPFTFTTLGAAGCFRGANNTSGGGAGADITICQAAGTLVINAPLNAGAGTIRLQSGGNVTQTAAGTLTAANLGVVAATGIALDVAVNAISNNLAANDSTSGAVKFRDNTAGVTVNQVTASTCFTGATGVVGPADVTLSNTGNLVVSQPVTSGAANTVRLTSTNGSVTQTAAGVITAGSLGVVAATGIGLDTAVNVVGNFAADDTTSGAIKLRDNVANLTTGNTVTADAPCFPAAVTGITGPADVTLCNTGNLVVNQALTAGAANTVRLTSTTGSVTQLATGVVTGGSLGAVAATGIGLDTAVNAVGNFTANDTTSGAIKLRDNVANLTLGNTVAADAPCFPAAVTGLTGPADITICNTGNLVVDQALTAGAGNTVRLTSSNGSVTQLASGVITASSLGVVAVTGIGLDTAVNVVGNFAASDTISGAVKFSDNVATLTLGNTVTADAPCFPAAVTGVTGPADVTICNTGNLDVNQALTAGAASTVRLTSTNGSVTQLATGVITGGSLGVVAATGIGLDTAVNAAGNFTASDTASGTIKLRDNVANLTLGNTVAADAPCFPAAVTGVIGPADVTICNTGNMTVDQALTAGAANTVRVTSTTGSVTQLASGVITASSLGVVAATGIGLDTAVNVVGNFTANDTTSGAVKFRDNVANLTLGNTVAADAPCFPTAVTGVAGPADGTICNTGNLAVNQALTAGAANTVRLTSTNGSVTQLTSGVITASSLGVVAATGIGLDTAVNVVGNFTANDTASGAVKFRDNVATLTLGNTVAADAPCFSAAVTGVTGPADVTICNTGNLVVDQTLTAGAANTVRLTSTTGSVTQLATGIITGASLGVIAATGIGLDTAVNAMGNFTASDTASGTIKLRDNVANLTLGNTVAADAPCFPTAVTGVTGPADVTICNTGNLTVNQALTPGAANSVRLTSTNGAVEQLATGVITASSLGVVAATGIGLDTAINVVGNFTANDTASGAVKFRDNVANLTLGNTVTADAPCFPAAVTGVTGPADVTICNTGNLTVNQALTAGAANTVRLISTTGSVTQLATGIITGGSLGVVAATGIGLDKAVNGVGNFTASDTASGTIKLRDNVANLTLGNTVAADAPCFPAAVTGVTGPADVTICNTGNLAVNQALTAGAANTVRLTSTNGSVTQLATGVITASSLGVVAATGIGLDTAVNVVGNFTANDTTSGAVKFRDNVATLTLGNTVAADAPCFPAAVTGVTGPADVTICNTGNLTVNQALTAGAANTVRLTSTNGSVTQLATGVITGGSLGVVAATGIGLDTAVNAVGNFTAGDTTSGTIKLRDNVAALTLGNTVAADAPCFPAAVTGVTGPADVTICNTGNLVVDQALTAGAGNTVRLTSTTGSVTQLGSGVITASSLGVVAATGIGLDTAVNVAGDFTANDTTSGAIKFRDNVATLTLGNTVAADAPCFPAAVTGVTGPADITICNTGNLTVNQALTAGAANTVRLTSTNGSVTQLATGIISANNLGVSAATGILLDTAVNLVTNDFTAIDSTSGAIKFRDNTATLKLGDTIAADAPCFAAAVTGVVGPADVTICNNGNLVIDQALTAGAANTVRLTSTTGSVTQLATGIISASNLGVSAATGILLDTAVNLVRSDFSASDATSAAIKFRDNTSVLKLGDTIAADGPCFAAAIAGVVGPADITICNSGTLHIDQALTAGAANTVRLTSTNGAVEQEATGVISASNLGVAAANGTHLDAAVNVVTNDFTASNTTSGTLNFRDNTATLKLGDTIAADTPCFPAPLTGVVGIGNITICNSGSLVVDQALTAGAANTVRLTSTSGSVTQLATGIITGGSLGVVAPIGILLDTAVNAVGNFTASDTASGNIKLRDNVATLTLGNTIAVDTPCFPTAITGVVGPADITICNTGNITANQVVTTGASATLRIQAGGGVAQVAGAVLTARDLAINAAGNVALDAVTNHIARFFAAANTGGFIHFTNAPGLRVTGIPIAADAPCFPTPVSGVTATGNIVLTAVFTTGQGVDDLVTSNGAVIRSTGSTVTLQAGGNINLQPGTTTEANGLLTIHGNFTSAGAGTNVLIDGIVKSDTATIQVSGGQLPGNNSHNHFVIDSNAGPANNGGTVGNVLSPITIIGGGGTDDTLVTDDTGVPATTVTLSQTGGVTGHIGAGPADTFFPAGANLTYNGLTTLTMNLGSHGNTVNVQGTTMGLNATINSGNGADTFNVSSDAPGHGGVLDLILGPLTLNAGGGGDTANISDLGSSHVTHDTLALTHDAMNSTLFTQIQAAQPTQVAIDYSGFSTANITLSSPPVSQPQIVHTAYDGIVGPLQIFPNPDPNANTIQIISTNNLTNLAGGAGNDQFIFSNGANLTNGTITGGGGAHNLLDYEAAAASVQVNFGSVPFTSANVTARLAVPAAVPSFVVPPNSAPGTGGVFGVQDAIGSNAGGNILAGDASNNRLEGRANHNIIFGGGGHDVIIGDSSDLLFSGGAAVSNSSIIFEGHSAPNALAPTQLVSDPRSQDLLVINSCAEFFARQVVLAPSFGSTIVALNGTFANPNDRTALIQLLQDTQVDPPAPPAQGNGGSLTPQQFAANRHQVALAIVTSMEHNASVINGYFQQFLGRSADTNGLKGWLNFLALGGHMQDVVLGILGSAEYFAKHGGSNATFIQALYHDLLGRAAAAQEVATWVQALTTMSRAAAAAGFLNSNEYRTTLLAGWYQQYLGRALDAGGRTSWLAQMRGGTSWEQVQAALLTSAEFQARVNGLASDPNQSFIAGLYLRVLGRSASSADLAFWVGVLNTP